MRKRYLLFDLDGTVSDSSEGITKSVSYALGKMGIKEDRQEVLRKYIGPPLDDSFRMFHGFKDGEELKAISFYRERYNDIGLYENKLFDGMKKLLADLRNDGYIIAMATCKPEMYLPKLLDYFQIGEFFHVTVGSELEGGVRRRKNQVIDEVFVRLGEKGLLEDDDIEITKSKAIMIGDRRDDILGAKASGIESMGVRYGFAEDGELEEAGADYIATDVQDIRSVLNQL